MKAFHTPTNTSTTPTNMSPNLDTMALSLGIMPSIEETAMYYEGKFQKFGTTVPKWASDPNV